MIANIFLIILIISTICLIPYVIGSINQYNKRTKEIIQYINHLYKLFDIMALDCSIPVRCSINAVRRMGHLQTSYNMHKIIRESLITEYATLRPQFVEKINNIIDPEKKEKALSILSETDNMITLMETVTDNSSSEYEKQITNEVRVCIEKIKEIY